MFKFLVKCVVILSFVSNANADQQKMVQKIESYLAGLKTFEADLVQQNPDQSIAKGKFYLDRPQKFRVQYSEPKEKIVVSDGSFFIEYDPKEDIPNFISIESTPASLFLQEKLKLSGDVSVQSIIEKDGLILASVYKTKEPDVGVLTLVFSQNPMSLIGWVIEDAQQNTTSISLSNIKENKPINKKLFETSRISR